MTASEDSCQLILLYETQKTVEVKEAILLFSTSKYLYDNDTIPLNCAGDTIFFSETWKYPVYLKLELLCEDGMRSSNIFHYDSHLKTWEVSILDYSLSIKHKPVGDDFKRRNSLVGLVLILTTALEMIIALLVTRLLGWPHLLVFIVLAANIASFPLYLVSISDTLLREFLVAGIKLFVMVAIGWKRIVHYRILLFAIGLLVVSFGIREFLFFLMSIV